ncbi:MAG: DUF4381 domain-containing protein [Magnetospirillum sp. WYHS-4]
MTERLDTTFRLAHRLRDIVVPEDVSAWPPGIGWWLAGLLGAAAAGFLGWWWYRRGSLRREAVAELNRLHAVFFAERDLTALAAGLSVLLRRVALARHPRTEVASLTGAAWTDFLGPGFDDLADLPYRPPLPVPGDLRRGRALISRARKWIGGRT